MEKYTLDDANSANIINIANDFLNNRLSLRDFAKLKCSFSYVTLRDKFLNVLPRVDEALGMKIKEKLEQNNAKKITQKESGKLRILTSVNFLLDGKNINEIAEYFGVDSSTVYRDLTERLNELDVKEEIKLRVKNIMQDNRLFNLQYQNRGR